MATTTIKMSNAAQQKKLQASWQEKLEYIAKTISDSRFFHFVDMVIQFFNLTLVFVQLIMIYRDEKIASYADFLTPVSVCLDMLNWMKLVCKSIAQFFSQRRPKKRFFKFFNLLFVWTLSLSCFTVDVVGFLKNIQEAILDYLRLLFVAFRIVSGVSDINQAAFKEKINAQKENYRQVKKKLIELESKINKLV